MTQNWATTVSRLALQLTSWSFFPPLQASATSPSGDSAASEVKKLSVADKDMADLTSEEMTSKDYYFDS